MTALLKFIGGPGSLGFLVAGIALALVVRRLRPRWRGLTVAWLVLLTSTYVVLSIPEVAMLLAGSVSSYHQLEDLNRVPRPAVLVVLGGDNAEGRVRESVRTYRVWQPERIVVLGDAWFADHIRDAGVPAARIRLDSAPGTTRLQMDWIRDQQPPLTSAAVIASRLQMPRVAALADAMGLTLTLVPSTVDDEPSSGWRRWIPTAGGLQTSRDALYEHAALTYYQARGWIRARRD